MGYYEKRSDLYFEMPEDARRRDLIGERFDYEAMTPPEPLIYDGRFIVTCLRYPRSTKRLYVIVYDLRSWPIRVIEHRGWFKDERRWRPSATSAMPPIHGSRSLRTRPDTGLMRTVPDWSPRAGPMMWLMTRTRGIESRRPQRSRVEKRRHFRS